ncbi:DUF58 domain-containing protein [Demequina pelophila]|uniref:DUF58 domain-containing protein n=1 Tax=Demequina pelophila TaxID=1638984 RepID=UPI000783EF7B|nr:DUF58 domain-containing protein [Demequina pelophila]
MTEPSALSGRTRSGVTAATGMRTRTEVAGRRRGVRIRAELAAAAWAQRARVGIVRGTRAVRRTVTPTGWLAAVWAVLGVAAGLAWGWDELLVSGLAAGALLVLAVPFLLGRAAYDVDFALERDAIVAGAESAAQVVVRNVGTAVALPGRIELPVGPGLVDLPVPLLRGGAEHRTRVVIPGLRRGIIDVGPATTTRSDPLRLLHRRFHWAEVRTLYVHPRTVDVPSTSLGFVRDLEGRAARTLTSEDISFHAVREYERGDPLRHIHWRSTARTGTLMVRQFEQTRRSVVSIVLDVDAASYAHEAEFEMAVSAVASLAVRARRDGREVEVVIGGAVPEFARATMRSVRSLRTVTPRALLDDLSGVEAAPAVAPLGDVTRMLAERGGATSLVFLATGARQPLAAARSAALHMPDDVSVATLVCDLEAEPGTHALGTMQVVTLGMLDDLRHLLARGVRR